MAHCDLKPENILFSPESDNPQEYAYKLGDFGVSQILEDGQIFPFTSIDNCIGYTPLWASPEVKKIADLRKVNPQNTLYDPFKADVFSLALAIIFLINQDEEEIKRFRKHQNLSKLLEPINTNYKKIAPFLEKMLAKNPKHRISFGDLKTNLKSYEKDAQVPNEEKFMEISNLINQNKFEPEEFREIKAKKQQKRIKEEENKNKEEENKNNEEISLMNPYLRTTNFFGSHI